MRIFFGSAACFNPRPSSRGGRPAEALPEGHLRQVPAAQAPSHAQLTAARPTRFELPAARSTRAELPAGRRIDRCGSGDLVLHGLDFRIERSGLGSCEQFGRLVRWRFVAPGPGAAASKSLAFNQRQEKHIRIRKQISTKK